MRALNLIIQREFMSRVNTKAFILTTLLTPFLFVGVIALPTILMVLSDNDNIKKVYVQDETNLYSSLFESSADYEFVILKNGEKKPDEKGTALLSIVGDLNKNAKAVTFYSEKQQPPRELTSYINDKLTDAVRKQKVAAYTYDNEIDPQVVANLESILNSKERVEISSVRWDETGEERETLGEIASVAGMILTFCMFTFIMMYGSMVMQSVVEEKTNRIIEVIISSVRPFDLMMGKIIGVGLVGLLQLAVWIIIGGGVMFALSLFVGSTVDVNAVMDAQQMGVGEMGAMVDNSKLAESMAGIASINWTQIAVCLLFYFVGGYLLYASVFAMLASGANDSQEASQLMTPAMIVLFIAFYAGFAASRNPEGAMAFWCSLIPFTSPVVMMVRAPFEIPLWELILSIVILFATAILTVKLAAKIYRVGILMFGKKVTFAEMFKWLNYK